MEHVEEDDEVMMVPFLPLHESDTEEENLVEVVELSSSNEGDESGREPSGPPQPPPTSADFAEWCTSLLSLGNRLLAKATRRVASYLDLPLHDNQWCLGPGRPVGEPADGNIDAQDWCMSGWVLSHDDQSRLGYTAAENSRVRREVALLGTRKEIPGNTMKLIAEYAAYV